MKQKVFCGTVGRTIFDTKPKCWEVEKDSPNKPNVIYILLDDMGFATTVKANRYTPVTEEYEVPFEFKGKLHRLVLHQAPGGFYPEEELKKVLSVE